MDYQCTHIKPLLHRMCGTKFNWLKYYCYMAMSYPINISLYKNS